MEGVFDAPMRALIAEIGGFDFAVSEFIRVSQQVLPAKVIREMVPELRGIQFGRSSLPLQIQLLGHQPEFVAGTAVEACVAGARSIDLNFGCPSPTVNRRQGGAALLRNPGTIHKIVEAVRRALPSAISVSAKIRLGWDHPEECLEIAKAACDGGADWLVIHARTRAELYRRGVHWEPVAEVMKRCSIPVVANGDLFTIEDLAHCREATGCTHFMMGRGALKDPFIGRRFSAFLGLERPDGVLRISEAENALVVAVRRWIQIAEPHADNSGYILNRLKQWMKSIRSLDETHISEELMSLLGKCKTSAELLDLLSS